jgi:hypothetical protein
MSMTDEPSNQDAPRPEPEPPRESLGWTHFEEGRKGFAVMPTEPAEPINILDQIGGPPAPEVLDSRPGESPSAEELPAPSPANDSE